MSGRAMDSGAAGSGAPEVCDAALTPERGTAASGAVGWEGAVNARRVAGDIFRMGRAEWLTSAGWQQAYDDGVRTIVDLRNPGERSRRPTDPVVPPAALERFTVLNRPTEEPGHPNLAADAPYMNHPRFYLDNVRIFPQLIAEVFRTLAHAEGAVVVHCSAGRDRTGMVSMMLLQLAGVPAGQIADAHELGIRGINDWHRISPYRHPVESYISGEELEARVADMRGSLLQVLSQLEVEPFLLRHGLARSDIEALRARMAG
ncbi:tyrosine-protein phosphatase [Arthrobacter sp.]|uniref:tyrosine-protein phosphatase n=1 Tax=Arthrobacter sp. TaxID=1667 RepID=UPI0033943DF7